MSTSSTRAVRETIAIGPVESFVFPIPVGFVSERASIGVGENLESPPVTIDHAEHVAISGLFLGGAGPYRVRYRTLISSDGIDGSNGEYKNASWSDWTVVIAAGTADRFHVLITPATTQAIMVDLRNDGAGPIVASPRTATSEGLGVHVRVHHWS